MGPAASESDPSRWNIETGINQSIELTMRPEFTDEVVRLADSHSAEYDGWGTSI
jgi:regulator of RNase E activity RraB